MTAIEQKPAMPGTETGLRKVWTTPTVILSEVSEITANCSFVVDMEVQDVSS